MAERAELEDRVGRAMLGMIRQAEDAQERAARRQGLHPTDFRCLGYLLQCPEPVSPREIIAHLGLTSGAATALLDRLEKAGFIGRIPHPQDRRSVLIVLDEKAAAEPLALHERIRAEYQAGMTDFSNRDLEAIATFLQRMGALSSTMNEGLYREPGEENPAS